ncbi:hypothetical protein [Enterococcus sp. AZ192]|uniref:hypothetical protein n=1 Tax=unclassified Enterococcus TaxID=2608891 RepID=UPI003D2AAB71
MKRIYILSNNGTHKNYVKKYDGAYCGFGSREEAKAFDEKQAKEVKALLDRNMGEAFIEEGNQ